MSGANVLGRVQGRRGALRGAAELGCIRGGVMEGMAQHLLVFHNKRLLQLSNSYNIFLPKRFRSGALAGGRVAQLFVAFFVGVVSRVPRPLAALTGVRALRVVRSEDDLAG